MGGEGKFKIGDVGSGIPTQGKFLKKSLDGQCSHYYKWNLKGKSPNVPNEF